MKGPPIALRVRVHPRASRTRVEWDGEVLQVWVTAIAVEGAANRALLKVVGDALDVPTSRLELRRGLRTRTKVVELRGIEPVQLNQRLEHHRNQ